MQSAYLPLATTFASMIVVTGAGGFIGSRLIGKLNENRFFQLVAVDHFDKPHKLENLAQYQIAAHVSRDDFFEWLDQNHEEVEFIFHLGARTNTKETDVSLLNTLNTQYSQRIWNGCIRYQIPLIYASSAATYGHGEHGFGDDLITIQQLQPLNAYAQSKHQMDLWALAQPQKPFFWAGLKFFNVYGPSELHKGKMASMPFQLWQQIVEKGKVRLFKSNSPELAHGAQSRDFISVDEVCNALYWFMHHRRNSGIYNIGSGHATTFNSLVATLFAQAGLPEAIEYFDMPAALYQSYQSHTQADLQKISSIGFPMELISQGINLNYFSK